MWSVSQVTFVDTVAQVSLTRYSIFLFSNVSALKLATDQPNAILPTARKTNN